MGGEALPLGLNISASIRQGSSAEDVCIRRKNTFGHLKRTDEEAGKERSNLSHCVLNFFVYSVEKYR